MFPGKNKEQHKSSKMSCQKLYQVIILGIFHLGIFLLGGHLLCQNALSEFIQLTTQSSLTFKKENNEILLRTQIHNNGDESAHKLSIVIQGPNINAKVASLLLPNQSVDYEINLPATAINFDHPGSYLFPYILKYQNKNSQAFTALHVADIKVPPITESIINLTPARKILENTVELASSRKLEFILTNLSDKEVTINNLSLYAPEEIATSLEDIILPIKLSPKESLPITTNVSNKSALIGSQYFVSLIADGATTSQHISTRSDLKLNISPSELNPRSIMIGIIIICALVVFFTKGKKHQRVL